MRLLLCILSACLCALATSSPRAQLKPPRLALVIGNAAYPSATTPLATTVADARALADELQRSGFAVDLKPNLGKAEMRAAIDAFTGRISAGATALFYFSGYGVQVDRQSYLIPVNGDPWTAARLGKRCRRQR